MESVYTHTNISIHFAIQMPTKDAFKIIDLGNNDKTVENRHNYLQAEVMSYYIESNEKYYEIKCIFEKVIFSLVKKGYIHFIFLLMKI